MKKIAGCFFALALFMQPAFAADKAPDVGAALTQWQAAVQTGSVDDIMKLYDKKAIMISSFAQNPMTKREQIAGYFKQVVANEDKRVTIEESHPRTFGNVAVNSGRYTISYTQDGEPVELPARFSFTYLLKDGAWLIVDQHSSLMPVPTEKK